MMSFFPYGEEELAYLSSRDVRLKKLIEQVGWIPRQVDDNLFVSLIFSIASQQISGKAAQTICGRLTERFDGPTPQRLAEAPIEDIQAVGMSMRKAHYIQTIAKKVVDHELDLQVLLTMEDEEVIRVLDELPGLGRWTAEMLLIFALKRPNVFSKNDFGIQKGLMKLYHHKSLTPARLERYQKRYAPYASIASFYLWELASRKDLEL